MKGRLTIDSVTRTVEWTFGGGGEGFSPGHFFYHKKHWFLKHMTLSRILVF